MGKDRKMGETKKTQWILLVIVISVVMFLGIIGRVFLLKENDVIDTEPEDDWRNWPKSLSDPEDRSGYSGTDFIEGLMKTEPVPPKPKPDQATGQPASNP
jgi:hypothetical protein